MIRSYIHLGLHLFVPLLVAATFYREEFLRAWITMTATMLVDVDHLFAEPVYDPWRCSIGYHPLHQYPAIAAFGLLCIWPQLRLVGIGLLIHMALDGMDCVWMQYEK